MSEDINISLHQGKPSLDAEPMKKRVGLIILATDHTTEPDFARMVASSDIGVYVARIAYANPTTPENLSAMQPQLGNAAGLILPDERLDAICYSCTSASVVMGDEAIQQAVQAARPDVPVVTPPLAAVLGLKAFGAKRIAVLTPYTIETSRSMATYFQDKGFEITRFTCLGFEDDRQMARISLEALIELARAATTDDAAALFISCTALRAASVITRIEEAIGRPVVSSNLATAWNCLRLCNNENHYPTFGRLMTLPLPATASS